MPKVEQGINPYIKRETSPKAPEQEGKKELTYSEYVPGVLIGTLKPLDKKYENGERMHFVEKGSGMFGLTNFYDNMKWAGIFTHLVLSARYSLYIGEQLQEKGYKVNLQTMLDSMLLSHTGRRQSDEAGEYKGLIGKDAYKKRANTKNELLGLEILEENKVPAEVLTQVRALANIGMFPIKDKKHENPEYAAYAAQSVVDHQVTHKTDPLHVRFAGFFMRNFKFEGESVNEDRARKRIEVKNTLEEIINTRKGYNLGRVEVDTDLYQALARMTSLGMSEESDRGGLEDIMYLVLQDAENVAFYEEIGIDLKQLRDETVPMPKWEEDIRYKYANFAKDGIIKKMDEVYKSTQEGQERDQAIDGLFSIFPFPDAKKWLIPYYHKFYEKHQVSEKTKSTPTVVFQASAGAGL
jgi:hypothetical protein